MGIERFATGLVEISGMEHNQDIEIGGNVRRGVADLDEVKAATSGVEDLPAGARDSTFKYWKC